MRRAGLLILSLLASNLDEQPRQTPPPSSIYPRGDLEASQLSLERASVRICLPLNCPPTTDILTSRRPGTHLLPQRCCLRHQVNPCNGSPMRDPENPAFILTDTDTRRVTSRTPCLGRTPRVCTRQTTLLRVRHGCIRQQPKVQTGGIHPGLYSD